ncbi:MAG: hypothetical protein AAF950_05045 [Pseudomonadota bacterium]
MTDPASTELPDKTDPMAKALFGWVEAKNAGQFIFWGLASLSVVLFLADALIDRHYKEEIEGITGFYAFYGFISFSFVVLMGWPLGRLLRQKPNFYGDEPDGEDGQ